MTRWSVFTYLFNWENIMSEPSAQMSSKAEIWNSNPLHERHHRGEWNRSEEQQIDNLAKHLLSNLLQVSGDISILLGGDFSQVCDCVNVPWSTEQTEIVECLMKHGSRVIRAHLFFHTIYSNPNNINAFILLQFALKGEVLSSMCASRKYKKISSSKNLDVICGDNQAWLQHDGSKSICVLSLWHVAVPL